MDDTKRIFQMTVCNLGRVFFNGDIFDNPNAVTRLANTEREAFIEGLEMIEKHIEKMKSLFVEKKPRKQRPAETEAEKIKKKNIKEKPKPKRGRKPKS